MLSICFGSVQPVVHRLLGSSFDLVSLLRIPETLLQSPEPTLLTLLAKSKELPSTWSVQPTACVPYEFCALNLIGPSFRPHLHEHAGS